MEYAISIEDVEPLPSEVATMAWVTEQMPGRAWLRGVIGMDPDGPGTENVFLYIFVIYFLKSEMWVTGPCAKESTSRQSS